GPIPGADDEEELLVGRERRCRERGDAGLRRVCGSGEILAAGRRCLEDVVDDPLRWGAVVRGRIPAQVVAAGPASGRPGDTCGGRLEAGEYRRRVVHTIRFGRRAREERNNGDQRERETERSRQPAQTKSHQSRNSHGTPPEPGSL